MKILLLSDRPDDVTPRVAHEAERLGHQVDTLYGPVADTLHQYVEHQRPDLIFCTQLTRRIPPDICQHYLCLVVHLGSEELRRPAPLERALLEQHDTVGLTLFQADPAMETNPVWGRVHFTLRQAAVGSLLRREVPEAAAELLRVALDRLTQPDSLTPGSTAVVPSAATHVSRWVHGHRLPWQQLRRIDWQQDSTAQVLAKLHSADDKPGVEEQFGPYKVRLYGAKPAWEMRGPAGEFIGSYGDALCRATRDGAVWIRQLKCTNHPRLPPIKLPATRVAPAILSPEVLRPRPYPASMREAEDVQVVRRGDIAYIHFDFCGGAIHTQACHTLRERIVALKHAGTKILVLLGGEDYWCTGIHLGVIEASDDPGLEAWRNINAQNDLILELLNSPEHVTIAALRQSARAGGAMLALCSDLVLMRRGIVLKPHYQATARYGSAYWKYLLGRRAGHERAERCVSEGTELSADRCLAWGIADDVLPESWQLYEHALQERCTQLLVPETFRAALSRKAACRNQDETQNPLAEYRREELAELRLQLFETDSEFHQARRQYLYGSRSPIRQQT